MDPSTYSFFNIAIAEGIATVTFNRPDTGNKWALSEEHELFRLPEDLRSDKDIRVVVLTGSGDTFSGGAHHSDDPFDAYDYYDRSVRLFRAYLDIDQPVVVALNGRASGSGLTLAMFGDIVIAERHVLFSDPHVLGGVASATGPFQWPLNIGLLRSKRYLLTGDSFTAEEAEAMGLVTEVVERGESLARAGMFAKQLAGISPSAVQATKRNINQWLRTAYEPIFQHALSLEFMTFPAATSKYGSGFDPSAAH